MRGRGKEGSQSVARKIRKEGIGGGETRVKMEAEVEWCGR